MALIRWQRPETSTWSPFRQLSMLRDEIDRLFDSPLNDLTTNSQQFLSGWLPALDLYDEKDHLVLRAELPGMKKEKIDISLHGDVLTLSGEREEDKKHGEGEVYRSERFLGRFQRSLTLPVPVNAEDVRATYQDGILTVRLAKAEAAKPRQIEVKVQ